MSLSPKKVKILALAGAGAVAVVLAASGAAVTGAYFSDTKPGHISGTAGSIKVSLSGGSGLSSNEFSFDRLLPGTPQSVLVYFTNTGNSPEDVYLGFPNATALSALNNLGTYGEVHVVDGAGVAAFDSANLNDRVATCGPLSPSGCWPLPASLKIASNVAPGASGHGTFTFGYPSKLSKQTEAGGGDWNPYPIAGQTTVNSGDGNGTGLPMRITATQVGQTP